MHGTPASLAGRQVPAADAIARLESPASNFCPGFRCTSPVRDPSRESIVGAGRHERTHTPAGKTRNSPAYNEALRRRGSLTIRFDPEMTGAVAPTGWLGRQPDCSDAAIQTCPTMKGEGRPENSPVDCLRP